MIAALFAWTLAAALPCAATAVSVRAVPAGTAAPLSVHNPLFAAGLPGPVVPAQSGFFAQIYRLDTPLGPVALKVAHSAVPGEARHLSEAEMTREAHARYHDPALAAHVPAPDNFRLARLLDYGSMDRALLPKHRMSGRQIRPIETMVLEWVEAQRLGDYLAAGGAVSAEDWRGFKSGVARLNALGYAHGDIKDDNVLVRRDPGTGHAVFTLVDFGIMKRGAEADERRMRLEKTAVRSLEEKLKRTW